MVLKIFFLKLNLSARNKHTKSTARLNVAPPSRQPEHGPRGLKLSFLSAWFQPKEEAENTEATSRESQLRVLNIYLNFYQEAGLSSI